MKKLHWHSIGILYLTLAEGMQVCFVRPPCKDAFSVFLLNKRGCVFEITKSEENAPGYCRSHGSRVKEEVRTGWIKPCVYKWGNCTLKQFEIAVCSSFGRMARADAVLTPWAPHLEQLSPDSCCTSVLSGTLCSHGQGHSTQPSLRNCLIPFLFLQNYIVLLSEKSHLPPKTTHKCAF